MRWSHVGRVVSLAYCAAVILGCDLFVTPVLPAGSEVETPERQVDVYKVNKRVRDFPEREDFTAPESAYAVVNRVMARGEEGAWRRISVRNLADRLPPADRPASQVSSETARRYLDANILEVMVFAGRHAAVIAALPSQAGVPVYDRRTFGLEDGRWLNKGQSHFSTLERARTSFARYCAHLVQQARVRPRVEDPEGHLKPFVQFLRAHAQAPKPFVMRALAEHPFTIIGEIHHRPRYWAFNCSLVTDPNFPTHVGTIYLELPSNDQHLVDTFLAGRDCDTTPVIEMLRDNLWMGWPDQAMLDFFMTVWMRNQSLSPERRLRIVLVDMQRPWSRIEQRQDWRQYETDRDKLMADNIVQDIRKHWAETRHRLFIVGVGHTALNMEYVQGFPVTSAGWHLRKRLGADRIYAIFPHRAVQTNAGRVSGRLAFGLFESAFAALGNAPMAFPLDVGPFGAEPYDADPDNLVGSTYADGFDAYLYLGPLETEIFSPLIAGFYTDTFVKELARRFRMMHGRSWAQAYQQASMNPETFIAWMGNSWGKPRQDWWPGVLGPLDAWHRGGRDWKQPLAEEKLAHVMDHPEEVVQAARTLFKDIQDADYDAFLNGRMPWDRFPTAGRYMAHRWHDQLVLWICKTFKDNPIVAIQVGDVFVGDREILGRRRWPTVAYELTLKDGTILKGELAFEFNFDGGKGHWHGMEGIDWHLQPEKNRSAPAGG